MRLQFWRTGKDKVTSSLPLLPVPFWLRLVVPVSIPSMGQISTWKSLVLNRKTWNHITVMIIINWRFECLQMIQIISSLKEKKNDLDIKKPNPLFLTFCFLLIFHSYLSFLMFFSSFNRVLFFFPFSRLLISSFSNFFVFWGFLVGLSHVRSFFLFIWSVYSSVQPPLSLSVYIIKQIYILYIYIFNAMEFSLRPLGFMELLPNNI